MSMDLMFAEIDVCINGIWHLDQLDQKYKNDEWNPRNPERFVKKYEFEPIIISDKRIHAVLANVNNFDNIPYMGSFMVNVARIFTGFTLQQWRNV